MPRQPNQSEIKADCPCCSHSAGSAGGIVRSDNVRKHVIAKHKEIPWGFVDSGGYALTLVTPLLGIKYNPVTKRHGDYGYCFKCYSYICCSGTSASSKLASVSAHTCAAKQERERTGDAKSAPREKRTMNGGDDVLVWFKKYKVVTEDNDDGTPNIDKTFARLTKPTIFQRALKNKQLAPILHEMCRKAAAEHNQMYADYVCDPDDPDDTGPPEFDRDDIILSELPKLLSSETKETHKDKIIEGLRLENAQMDDMLDQQKIDAKRDKRELEDQLERLKEMYNTLHAETVVLREQVNKDNVISHA